MATYYSASKGRAIDLALMHPAHLINALNKQAREAAALGEQVTPEKLQLIGEMAVTLIQKGLELHAVDRSRS